MNRRITKRWACHHCASVLQTAFESGWPFNYQPGEEEWSPEDESRIGEAIEDIIAELYRRGLEGGSEKPPGVFDVKEVYENGSK